MAASVDGKLIEAHRAEWDAQSLAMMKANKCPDAWKKGIKAGM